MKKYISLILFIIIFEAVSYTIGMRTQDAIDGWYAALTKPPLTPPNIVFPIMWTTLYALIAGAGWVLWRRRAEPDGVALLALFAAYMALNWSWSFVFFGAQSLLTGLIWIAVMNVIAVMLIWRSAREARPATLLMIPPTLWTMFAMYLNAGLLWLN
ncbi:MAG: tryptophan-rich sensory protein [Alphaproteobacteria bacterium]|nr:tryptophan-rich sensory protein [Alphaproteobacteria bacterium]MBU0860135.1 tryptophan-rich sensory protein [Alphaproteobacteria bacterium]